MASLKETLDRELRELQERSEQLRAGIVAPPGVAAPDGSSRDEELEALRQAQDELRHERDELRRLLEARPAAAPGAPMAAGASAAPSGEAALIEELMRELVPRLGTLERLLMQQRAALGQETQRVAVLVDVQNMYYAAKRLFGARLSYQKLLQQTVRGRQLLRAVAYIIERGAGPGQENFIDLLRNTGYEARIQHVGDRHDPNTHRGEWSLGIAVDALGMSDKVDTIVLVTGDIEFVELVKALQARGVRVEVVGFREAAAEELVQAANVFIPLGEETLYEKSITGRQEAEGTDAGGPPRARTTPREGYDTAYGRYAGAGAGTAAPGREARGPDRGSERGPERGDATERVAMGDRGARGYARPPRSAAPRTGLPPRRFGRPDDGRGGYGRPVDDGYAPRMDQPLHPGMPVGQPRRPHGSASYRPMGMGPTGLPVEEPEGENED